MRKINSDKVFGFVNGLLLILILLIMVYPLYFVIIASVSDPIQVGQGKLVLLPKGFTLDSYKEAFREKQIWVGYRNSIYYTVVGTLFNLFLTVPTAYALSKKKMRFHGALTFYYVFTMYFGGGLLPYYLLVKEMGLINKPYTLIVLGGLSVYNVVVTRTYFANSIPESLYEATEIDGGSEFDNFFRIALPLSKPIIAVIALYYAVGRWNDYFTAMIYTAKKAYQPLQTVLRGILLEGEMTLGRIDINILSEEEMAYYVRKSFLVESMKYSIIFIASLPMLIAYPFVQKYFVQGVMIGSVKG